MQTIEQYLAASGYAGANVTPQGAASTDVPYFVVGMPCVYVAHLVGGAPEGLANVASWKFVFAGDFDPDTAPCFTTDEVVFDETAGTWTVLLDGTRTADMLALLGDEPWVDIGCEIVGLDEDEDWAHPAYVLQWTARMRNRRDSDGAGVDPATRERVANVLAAGGGVELRVGDGGALVIVHGGTTSVVTLEALAAAAAGGVSAAERAVWSDKTKIVAGNTVVDVTEAGEARHYVKDESVGSGVFATGSDFSASYGSVSYAGATTLRFAASPVEIADYGAVWIDAETDIVPSAYKPDGSMADFPGYPARIGWHLWAPTGSTAPTQLRYFESGPRYDVSGWADGAPAIEIFRGSETGTRALTRPVVDAGVRHALAHADHVHAALVAPAAAHELRMPDTGTPVVASDVQKTVGASCVLTHSESGTPVTKATVAFLSDFTWAEMAGGDAVAISVSVLFEPVSGAYPAGGTPFAVRAEATGALAGTSGGVASFTMSSDNARLDGGTLTVDSGGAVSLAYFDPATDPALSLSAGDRDDTQTATRTATIKGGSTKAVATTDQIPAAQVQSNWNETDADSKAFIKNKPTLGNSAGKNVGTAAGTVAAGDHTHSGYATTAQLRYTLVEPELTPSGTTVSATLQDRAVNAVTLASTVTAATFTFPAPVEGYARDFFLRLVIEGSTVPTISFLESGGGSLEDVFDADDDAWAEIESGVNVLMFTETSQEAGS